MSRPLDRALALADEMRGLRARGDVVSLGQDASTVDDLVGYWQGGALRWPRVVLTAYLGAEAQTDPRWPAEEVRS